MKKIFKTITPLAVMLVSLMVYLHAEKTQMKSKASDFTLTDIYGKSHKLSDSKGKFVVLEWTNYGCPFVQKHYNSGNMQALQKEMTAKGVEWFAICSSAQGKEGFMSAEEWQKASKEKGSNATAILLDTDGKVGKAYGAKSTPHMFVIDPEGEIVYRGAIDDKPTTDVEDVKTAKNYVRAALNESMAGKPVTKSSTASYGCSVKY